jgi:hypothetical protein
MRLVSSTLLLSATLAFHGACFAQAAVPAAPRDAADARADAPRSAFGKVMAVMISALQQQSHAQATASAPVRTTAAGTPMDIEIGAAFRDDMNGRQDTARQATGSGGAAAADASRAAPPQDLAIGQTALAGPG